MALCVLTSTMTHIDLTAPCCPSRQPLQFNYRLLKQPTCYKLSRDEGGYREYWGTYMCVCSCCDIILYTPWLNNDWLYVNVPAYGICKAHNVCSRSVMNRILTVLDVCKFYSGWQTARLCHFGCDYRLVARPAHWGNTKHGANERGWWTWKMWIKNSPTWKKFFLSN